MGEFQWEETHVKAFWKIEFGVLKSPKETGVAENREFGRGKVAEQSLVVSGSTLHNQSMPSFK